MGWAGFDRVIGFLIRTVANASRKLASVSWPVYSGNITSYHYKDPFWGCDYGEYRYKYSVKGSLYRGMYRDPYFVSRAREAQNSGSIGTEIQVRVCPNDPTKSVLNDF